MRYSKKHIRNMMPLMKQGAKLANDLDSLHRKLTNWLEKVQHAELKARAIDNHRCPAVQDPTHLFEEEL